MASSYENWRPFEAISIGWKRIKSACDATLFDLWIIHFNNANYVII